MSNETRQSFLQRLSRFDALLFAAYQIAAKRYEDTVVPDELWQDVKKELAGVSRGEERGAFVGDITAACLRGYFLADDPKVAGELATLQDPEKIRGRNQGRFDTWKKSDQVALYELEIQRDRLIDKVDLGSRIAHVIVDEGKKSNQRGRYAVQDFQALRATAGVTRSGLFRDGKEIREDFRLMRRTKDSVRHLLEMLGETNLEDDVEVPAERTGMTAFYKAVNREARRNEHGDLEFAIRRSRAWLVDRESKADQIAIQQEIATLGAQKVALETELTQAVKFAAAATVAVVRKIREQTVTNLRVRVADVATSLRKAEERLAGMKEAANAVAPKEFKKLATLGDVVAARKVDHVIA